MPSNLLSSTIVPIPKKCNYNATVSDIALSSILGKIFDYVILDKYSEKLSTCDLQFSFKRNRSTHMCTMVLKETISYYVKNSSSVFCTFLDAIILARHSKGFIIVSYFVYY